MMQNDTNLRADTPPDRTGDTKVVSVVAAGVVAVSVSVSVVVVVVVAVAVAVVVVVVVVVGCWLLFLMRL